MSDEVFNRLSHVAWHVSAKYHSDWLLRKLEPRDVVVCFMLAADYCNREIAKAFGVSLWTAKDYVAEVIKVTCNRSRTGVVSSMYREGMVDVIPVCGGEYAKTKDA